jgi:hypothetical protein
VRSPNSLGPAAPADPVELRAAELANPNSKTKQSHPEFTGYMAHFYGTDVPPGGWAGWLARQIRYHDEESMSDLTTELRDASAGHAPPSEDWNGALDEIEGELDIPAPAAVATDVTVETDDLAGVDQSEPAEPEQALMAVTPDHDTDDEPTHVGAVVDGRFDDGGE